MLGMDGLVSAGDKPDEQAAANPPRLQDCFTKLAVFGRPLGSFPSLNSATSSLDLFLGEAPSIATEGKV